MTGIPKKIFTNYNLMRKFSPQAKKAAILGIFILLLITSYLAYSNYKSAVYQNSRVAQIESEKVSLQSQINNLRTEIQAKTMEISSLKEEIDQKKREIHQLQERVNDLEKELGITRVELEEAKPYRDRINRCQNIAQSYSLLKDREDYARPIILDYLGLNAPVAPRNDDELWERGKLIYNWLSDNYEYCGDKGLRVGTTFYEFQFWSPDEILVSDNARCGDCDDFATLFAGLMYASGVPENKVWVVCGSVSSGGHCWNWLSLSNKTYRIDPVCSQRQELFNFLGLSWGPKGAYYTSTKENIQCFSEYNEQMKMNANTFYSLSVSE